MTFRLTAAFSVLALATAFLPAAGDKPAEKEQPAAVYKFVGMKQAAAFGRPCWMVTVAPVAGGPAGELILPNKNGEARKLDPVEAYFDVVKAAKSGDLLEIELTRISNRPAIRAIKSYHPKPGEEEPGVFVFAGKSRKGEQTVVNVTKYLQPFTLVVPSKKDAAGKMAPDAELLAAIDAVKDGDSVEVQAAGQTLKSIKAYVPPRRVEFVKLVKQKVDDKEYSGMEIKEGGPLLVNPKTHGALLGKLNTLTAGKEYLVKTTTEGGAEWLTDLKPAPKEDKPKDPPKDAPGY